MKTKPKKTRANSTSKVILKKHSSWKLWFLLGITFSVISVFIILHYRTTKNALDVSTEALKRAKELIANLPAGEDPYGIKQIFGTAEVLPVGLKGKGFDVKLQGGKEYCIVFFLPESQEDYKKTGGPPNALLYTSNSESPELPVFVVINPKGICDYKNNGVSLDYIASTFLHEVIHVYQRSVVLRNGQKVSYNIEDIKQREKEAYLFQSKFINQILIRNNINTRIAVPIIDIKMINSEGLENLCEETDKLNGYKLGPLASLVLFNAYPDVYVSIANATYSGEVISF